MTFCKAALTIYKVARRFLFSHNLFDKVAVTLFTFRNPLDIVGMTIGNSPMTLHTSCKTLYTFCNLLNAFWTTIFISYITLDKSAMTKTERQATH